MGAPLPELQRGARGKWRRWRRARERRRQERRRGGARPRWRAAAALGEAREEARELLRLELGDELGRRFGGSLEKPSRRRKPREGRRLCCVWSSTATSGSAAPPSSSSSSTSRCSRVVVQFLCSYVTLPLYALVSQMGSTMKQSIFDDQTSKALKNWRAGVKKKPGANSKHGAVSPTPGSPRDESGPDSGGGGVGIALTQRKNSGKTKGAVDAQADSTGTGLQAGAAQPAAGAKQGGESEYEFIKLEP